MRSAPGSPWPLPKSWEKTDKRVTLDPAQFYISSAASDCDVIDEALKRYKKIIITDSKGLKHEDLPVLLGLQVKVKSNYTCGYPMHNDIESCKYTSKINITTNRKNYYNKSKIINPAAISVLVLQIQIIQIN